MSPTASNGSSTKAGAVVDDQYYGQQQLYQSRSNSALSSSSHGPNLVNKQLVLPFVPPAFPNGSADGSNHLIKPSEYLKSISDKRSNAGSQRLVRVLNVLFLVLISRHSNRFKSGRVQTVQCVSQYPQRIPAWLFNYCAIVAIPGQLSKSDIPRRLAVHLKLKLSGGKVLVTANYTCGKKKFSTFIGNFGYQIKLFPTPRSERPPKRSEDKRP